MASILRRTPADEMVVLPPGYAPQLEAQGMSQFQKGVRSTSLADDAGAMYGDALEAQQRGLPNAAQLRAEAEALARQSAIFAPRVGAASEIGGVGDAVDWGLSNLGSALYSTGPSIAGGVAGSLVGGPVGALASGYRGLRAAQGVGQATRAALQGMAQSNNAVRLGSTVGGALGAAYPGYQMERNEALGNAMADPVAAAQAPGDILSAANQKGMINAAGEMVLPAMIGSRVGQALFGGAGKLSGRQILRDALITQPLVEGATETGQEAVGQYYQSKLNPNRDTSKDMTGLGDAFAAGAAAAPFLGLPGHASGAARVFAEKSGKGAKAIGKSSPVQAALDEAEAAFKGGKDLAGETYTAFQEGRESAGHVAGGIGKAAGVLKEAAPGIGEAVLDKAKAGGNYIVEQAKGFARGLGFGQNDEDALKEGVAAVASDQKMADKLDSQEGVEQFLRTMTDPDVLAAAYETLSEADMSPRQRQRFEQLKTNLTDPNATFEFAKLFAEVNEQTKAIKSDDDGSFSKRDNKVAEIKALLQPFIQKTKLGDDEKAAVTGNVAKYIAEGRTDLASHILSKVYPEAADELVSQLMDAANLAADPARDRGAKLDQRLAKLGKANEGAKIGAYLDFKLEGLAPNEIAHAKDAILTALEYLRAGAEKSSRVRRIAMQSLKPIDAAYAREYPGFKGKISDELFKTVSQMAGNDVAERESEAARQNAKTDEGALNAIQNALRMAAEKQGLPKEGERTMADAQQFTRQDLPNLAARLYARISDRFHRESKYEDVRTLSDGSTVPFTGLLNEAMDRGDLSPEKYAEALANHQGKMKKHFAEDDVVKDLKALGLRPAQIQRLEEMVLREMRDPNRLQTKRFEENSETRTSKLVENISEEDASGITEEDLNDLFDMDKPRGPSSEELPSGYTAHKTGSGELIVANPDGVPAYTSKEKAEASADAQSKYYGARIQQVDANEWLSMTGEDPRALEDRMIAAYDKKIEALEDQIRGMENKATPEFSDAVNTLEQVQALRERLAGTDIRQFLREKPHSFTVVSKPTGQETDFTSRQLDMILSPGEGSADALPVGDGNSIGLVPLLKAMQAKRKDSVLGQDEGINPDSDEGKLRLLTAGIAQLAADGHLDVSAGWPDLMSPESGGVIVEVGEDGTKTLKDLWPKKPPTEFTPKQVEQLLHPVEPKVTLPKTDRQRSDAERGAEEREFLRQSGRVTVKYKGREAALDMPAFIEETGKALGIDLRSLLGMFDSAGASEENTYIVPSRALVAHLLKKGMAMMAKSGVTMPAADSPEIKSAVLMHDIMSVDENDVKPFETIRGKDLDMLKDYSGPAALDRDETVKAEQRVADTEKAVHKLLRSTTGEIALSIAGEGTPLHAAIKEYQKARTADASLAAVAKISELAKDSPALLAVVMADTVMQQLDSNGPIPGRIFTHLKDKWGESGAKSIAGAIKTAFVTNLDRLSKEDSTLRGTSLGTELKRLVRAQEDLFRSMGWSDPTAIPSESGENITKKTFRQQAEGQYEGAEDRPGVTLFDQSTMVDSTLTDMEVHRPKPGELRQTQMAQSAVDKWIGDTKGQLSAPKFMDKPAVGSAMLSALVDLARAVRSPENAAFVSDALKKMMSWSTYQQAVTQASALKRMAVELTDKNLTAEEKDYIADQMTALESNLADPSPGVQSKRKGPGQNKKNEMSAELIEAPKREAGEKAPTIEEATSEKAVEQENQDRLEKARKNINALFDAFSKRSGKEGDNIGLSAEDVDRIIGWVKSLTGGKVQVEFDSELKGAGRYKNGVIYLNTTKLAESTQFHEVMHWVIEVLDKTPEGKKALEVLRKGTSTPAMRKWLEEQLAGETDALKQLDDGNERVTYAFEFFMRDTNMELPTGGETKGMFRTLFDWIKKLMRLSDNTAQTRNFFLSVAAGDFALNAANPAAIERMIGRTKMDDAFAWTKNKMQPFVELADMFFNSTIDRAKAIGNKDYDAVIELYANRRTGYIHNANAEATKLNNLAGAILENVSNDDRQAALDYLYDPNGQHSARAKELGAALEADVIAPLLERMRNAGVTVPMQGRMPVIFDVDRIISRKREFAGDIGKENADDIIQDLFDTQGYGHAEGLPEGKTNKWMSRDLTTVMRSLVFSGVNQTLLQEKDADGLSLKDKVKRYMDHAKETASAKEQAIMDGFIKSMEGKYGHKMSPRLQRLVSNVIVYQNILLLPFGVMSQMMDVLVIASRADDLASGISALARGFKELPRSWFGQPADRDHWERLAMRLGVAEMFSSLSNLSSLYAGVQTTGRSHAINEWFFKMNGMQQWNRSMHVAATQAAVEFLYRHKTSPDGHTEGLLTELGLKPDDIELDESSPYGIKLTEKLEGAIQQFVMESVAHPDQASNPMWMNDKMFALIAHLKRFSFAWHEYVLKRVGNRFADHGDAWPLFMMASSVPFMIFSDMLRDVVKPGAQNYKEGWGVLEYTWDGIQRSALFGRYNPAVEAATNENPFASILGPMAEQLERARTSIGKGDYMDVLKSAVPGKQMFAT